MNKNGSNQIIKTVNQLEYDKLIKSRMSLSKNLQNGLLEN